MKMQIVGLWVLALGWVMGLSACSPAGSAPVAHSLAQTCARAGGMVGLWVDDDGKTRQMCKSPGGHVCDDWAIRSGKCGR